VTHPGVSQVCVTKQNCNTIISTIHVYLYFFAYRVPCSGIQSHRLTTTAKTSCVQKRFFTVFFLLSPGSSHAVGSLLAAAAMLAAPAGGTAPGSSAAVGLGWLCPRGRMGVGKWRYILVRWACAAATVACRPAPPPMMVVRAGAGEESAVLLPPPVDLRVEGLACADGATTATISEPLPRFSFSHGDEAVLRTLLPRGTVQAAYRLTVSEERSARKLLWDSGTVRSSNCSQLEYGSGSGTETASTASPAPPLRPFARYIWSAEWWSSDGQHSASATSAFETGPTTVAHWQNASWLSGGTQLRAQWSLPPALAPRRILRARAYVAAPGCHRCGGRCVLFGGSFD
jgi:hypothetical protein